MTGQAFVLTQLSFLFSPTMLSVNDFYLDCFCFGDGTSLMAAQIPASYIWVAGTYAGPATVLYALYITGSARL